MPPTTPTQSTSVSTSIESLDPASSGSAGTGSSQPSQDSAAAGSPGLSDAFADLDALESAAEPAKTAAPPEKGAAAKTSPDASRGAQKAGEGKDATQPKKTPQEGNADEGEGSEGEPEIPDKAASSDKIPNFSRKADVREWAKEQGRIARERQEKIVKLEEKLKFLEKRGIHAPEVETATKERLAELERTVQEQQKLIASVRFEESDEYRKGFQEPYLSAVKEAYSDVEQLLVSTGSEEDGSLNERPATRADFAAIYQLPLGPAWKEARRLFGPQADAVMQHYNIIKRLATSATKAIESKRQNHEHESKAQLARQAVEQEGIQRMWRTINEDISKKYPQYFGPSEDDPEGNAILEKGYAMVDNNYGGDISQMNSEQRMNKMIVDARIRHQAAAMPVLARKLKLRDSKIAALEKELSEFKASSPGSQTQRATGTQAPKKGEGWEDSLSSLGDS